MHEERKDSRTENTEKESLKEGMTENVN